MTVKDRINIVEIQNFTDYIKNKYWYSEKKTYLIFLRNQRKYKLYYKAQRVLSRKQIIGLEYHKKYANGYWVYKLNKFIEWFMKNESEGKEDAKGC
jgi:hypothetical protein